MLCEKFIYARYETSPQKKLYYQLPKTVFNFNVPNVTACLETIYLE